MSPEQQKQEAIFEELIDFWMASAGVFRLSTDKERSEVGGKMKDWLGANCEKIKKEILK